MFSHEEPHSELESHLHSGYRRTHALKFYIFDIHFWPFPVSCLKIVFLTTYLNVFLDLGRNDSLIEKVSRIKAMDRSASEVMCCWPAVDLVEALLSSLVLSLVLQTQPLQQVDDTAVVHKVLVPCPGRGEETEWYSSTCFTRVSHTQRLGPLRDYETL